MITIDDVRAIAGDLPGVYEQPSYGDRPSWRTKQRMFTWIRDDPEALVIWVDSVEERDAFIQSDPEVFFTTDHYDGQPIVLVHLDQVDRDEAAELIIDSFRLRAPPSLVSQLDAD